MFRVLVLVLIIGCVSLRMNCKITSWVGRGGVGITGVSNIHVRVREARPKKKNCSYLGLTPIQALLRHFSG